MRSKHVGGARLNCGNGNGHFLSIVIGMASLLRVRVPQAFLKTCSRHSTATCAKRWSTSKCITARSLDTRSRSVTTAAFVSQESDERIVGRKVTDHGGRFFAGLDSVNPNLREVQYAVRGPVLDRAMEIQLDLVEVSSKPVSERERERGGGGGV